jgi:hypothetical protein
MGDIDRRRFEALLCYLDETLAKADYDLKETSAAFLRRVLLDERSEGYQDGQNDAWEDANSASRAAECLC